MARLAALMAGLTCLALASIAYLQERVPLVTPRPADWQTQRHISLLLVIAAIIGLGSLVAAGIGLALDRRQASRPVTVANVAGPSRLSRASSLTLRTSVGVSYALLLSTVVLGLPWWEVVVASAVPWLILFPFAAAWQARRYRFLAVLVAVVLVAVVAIAEDGAKLLELLISNGDGSTSKGILGQLNPEAVNATVTVLVWLGASLVLARFIRNPWAWVALIVAGVAATDALYSFAIFVSDHDYWAAGGINGVFGAGGVVATPLFRPYLEALLSFVVAIGLLMTLAVETRPVALPRFHVRVPERVVAGLTAATLAVPTVLISGATFAAAANVGALCTDVASSVGLDFSDPYGSTLSTDPMGRLYQRNLGQGAAVGDYTGDGYLDVYLLGQQGMPSRLYRNVPAPGGGRRFVDVTAQAGLAGQRGLGRAAFFADLDGTGRPDLVVLNDYAPGTGLQPSKIYRNNGDGTFTDVTAGSGFDPVGYVVGGASLADFFGDGRLDIYVSYWTMDLGAESPFHRIQGQFPGHNQLFRNLGNYRFEDVTNEVGLNGLTRDSFSSVFADFRQVGRLDLFQAVDHRTNLMYANAGGTVTDVSAEEGVARRGNNMGVAAASLYGDGLIDLYTTDITDPTGDYGTTQGNGLFVASRAANGSVVYTEQASARGVYDTGWGWGAAFVDMRLLGRLDLFVGQGMREMLGLDNPLYYGRSRLFLNDGSNHFTDTTGTGCDVLGDQRAVIPFDYNRDGAPDLLVTQVNGPVQLLQNQTRGRHWLTVDLSHAGPEAAGAEVSVTAANRTTTQLVLLGGSYLAGPPLEAYFGLGSASAVDSVSVRWANGGETVVRDVRGDQVLQINRS